MPEYRLKKQFTEVGAQVLTSLAQELTGQPDLDITTLLEDQEDVLDSDDFVRKDIPELTRGFSFVGGTLGSPLGLLPFLGQYYAAGYGALHRLRTQRVFKPARLSPEVLIRLHRRGIVDKDGNPYGFEDLADQGFDEKRVQGFLKATEYMPSPTELTMWMAREVFEPDAIAKYGLDDEFEKLDLHLFSEVGVSDEQALNIWRAHWQHASFTQVIQMRRRELINDDDVKDWFRLVEIPPFWREKLLALVWEIPTRVDVRRFWDMGTIDEERLRVIYTAQGYQGQDLDDYVLWTKVYVAFPDLVSRYKNGWIDEATVKTELASLGMSDERAEVLWQTKFKAPHKEERVEGTRQLTRALIIKGAKKDLIDKEQTIARLMDLGYGGSEAEYIYLVEVTESESPETPLDFQNITNAYRKAVGVTYDDITNDAILAERTMLDAKQALADAREKEEPQATIFILEAQAEVAETRFNELLARPGE